MDHLNEFFIPDHHDTTGSQLLTLPESTLSTSSLLSSPIDFIDPFLTPNGIYFEAQGVTPRLTQTPKQPSSDITLFSNPQISANHTCQSSFDLVNSPPQPFLHPFPQTAYPQEFTEPLYGSPMAPNLWLPACHSRQISNDSAASLFGTYSLAQQPLDPALDTFDINYCAKVYSEIQSPSLPQQQVAQWSNANHAINPLSPLQHDTGEMGIMSTPSITYATSPTVAGPPRSPHGGAVYGHTNSLTTRVATEQGLAPRRISESKCANPPLKRKRKRDSPSQ